MSFNRNATRIEETMWVVVTRDNKIVDNGFRYSRTSACRLAAEWRASRTCRASDYRVIRVRVTTEDKP